MIRQLTPLSALLELSAPSGTKTSRPISTTAFDWLYVLLSLLLTVGIMMDVWSHIQFGPDQSIFNEYHLLFYGSVGAILVLMGGLVLANLRNGYPLAIALPQGYGLGFLAAILFGISGVIDLIGHALFGFESGMEALTSPLHLLLFMTWFMILFAPVNANRARIRATGDHPTLIATLPSLIAYACMIICITTPFLNLFPMGSAPYMLQSARPDDLQIGLVAGIGGTLFQTVITIAFVLWLARTFRLPFGSYTVIFGLYGSFLTLLDPDLMPWLMFIGLGILLDVAYHFLKPDGVRRPQFILFAIIGSAGMWFMMYITLAYPVTGMGMDAFYYSGYNLYGSVAQAVALATLMAYLLSLPTPQPLATSSKTSNKTEVRDA